ncbi:MAG: tRNA pseudouridine(38-40) synthase TruA [Bacteroidetes bacterium]|nr:tRNA pseudouridine(38-40) synthase TruA [Bacteroidota bacterium]
MEYKYLIHIQYLGFRFHGWAKQPDLKTVHHMIDRTFKFVFGHSNFKTMGSSRTDAMVSANHSAFELFIEEELDKEQLLEQFNHYLPSDIKATSIEEVDDKFNIIDSAQIKEYVYLFAHGEKYNPLAASLVCLIPDQLNIDLMKEGASVFQGRHNFKKYCTRPSPNKSFERDVIVSKIEENKLFKANFFPPISFAYHIHSKGFMRNQVRLMMGQLLLLGKGEITLDNIKSSLNHIDDLSLEYIAPASGLILNKIHFTEK